MAQSQPNLGVLEPFYGWYKQVMVKLNRHSRQTREPPKDNFDSS
jgi:hypothetical protein